MRCASRGCFWAAVLALGITAGCGDATSAGQSLPDLPAPYWTVTSTSTSGPLGSPVAEGDGTLVLKYGSMLRGLASTSGAGGGATLWSVTGTLAMTTGSYLAPGTGHILVAGGDLLSLDPATGTAQWTLPAYEASGTMSTDPTRLFVVRGSGTPHARVSAVSHAGVPAWTSDSLSSCALACYFAGTARSGDTIYVAGTVIDPISGVATTTARPIIVALDRLTGAELWRRIDSLAVTGVDYAPLVSGNVLVLVSETRSGVSTLDRFSRVEVWRRTVDGQLNQPPRLSGELLVMGYGNTLVARSLATGSVTWQRFYQFTLDAFAVCPNSVIAASTLTLYAYNRSTGAWTHGSRLAITAGLGTQLYTSTGRAFLTTLIGSTVAEFPCP